MGNSLVVQWLGLRAFIAEGMGLIPGQGIKILQGVWCGQKKKSRMFAGGATQDHSGRTAVLELFTS